MSEASRSWIGLGGLPPGDNPRAYASEDRLHWVMIGVALLSIPALVLQEATPEPMLIATGRALDWIVFLAFSAEFAGMLWLTSHRMNYVMRNWLDIVIIASAAANLFGFESEWVAIARLLRLTLVGLLMARVLGSLRNIFTASGIPFITGLAAASLALSGAGFYWLEPTVHSYADGVWLAFVTGATIGYGDFVPTTTASRLFAGLMVLLGFTMFSLVTASIAAFFVGEDEKLLRREMHRDIRKLHDEIAQLIGDEERTMRREMHADIRQLRAEVAEIKRTLQTGAHGRDA